MQTTINAPDLTVRAPRSLRCRLGGYAVLPRMLDKCRATIAGTNGEYHFNCPLDQEFLSYTGLDPQAVRNQVATGAGDLEMLDWVQQNAPRQHAPWEIEQWSAYQERRAPQLHTELFEYFQGTLARLNPGRGDVRAWADLLDLDDHCSFGGAA